MTQTLPEIASKTLAMLVDPAHLAPDAIADARARFGSANNRHAVFDGFLAPALLPRLREVVAGDGDFVANLKVAGADKRPGDTQPRGRVDARDFAATPEERRFISQLRLAGPAEGREASAGMKAERFVRDMLASRPMHQWLEAVTGVAIAQTGGINFKLHGPGHFLRKHSDARPGRRLCAVLYLHEAWQSDWAGRFLLHMVDGSVRAIDPLPNRFVLFEANQENYHEIEPLGDVPPGWMRANYSVWFG